MPDRISNYQRERAGVRILPAAAGWDPAKELKVEPAKNPLPNGTLGDIGLGAAVGGLDEFPLTILVFPLDAREAVGIDRGSIRVFRWDAETRALKPLWNSGTNLTLGFIWAKIRRPGTYVPLGLPRDTLLNEALESLAYERQATDVDSPRERHVLTRNALRLFTEVPPEPLEELRAFLVGVESRTGVAGVSPADVKRGRGGHFLTFPLPKDDSLEKFRERLSALETPAGGLPEEVLFFPPEILRNGQPPWLLSTARQPWRGIDTRQLAALSIWKAGGVAYLPPWLFSQDWWMYQHDERHSGHASGFSDIRSTNVSSLIQQSAVPVDGPVVTKPSIVDGKIYVGSGKQGGAGATLYKIDLTTGNVDGTFPTTGDAWYSWISGIGGSPAVVGGRVYFTGVQGKVHCVDATTMTPTDPHPAPLWVTNLKYPDAAHNQPVSNPNGDSWSGPVVANGRVYVGCGEGEGNAFGFVYCLDADSGNVIWLFCTNQFTTSVDNSPNVIPNSAVGLSPLPAGFTAHVNPPVRGSSVWSSCAYDSVLNRIYVGTGNPEPDSALPSAKYSVGLLSLDANTGEFRGFFQPSVDDSYWPGDSDIDVPGSPTIFTQGGVRAVAFGSKNGSLFLLDPNTMNPLARRQLLPRAGGSGLPGDRGTAIPTVVPTGGFGENKYGVMGTPAVGLNRIYVGIGGYDGLGDGGEGIGDPIKTPFIRSLDWSNLYDAWPTVLGADNVTRYACATPPLYLTREVGLSSPAVVSDVVFISTNKTGLYALDGNTGFCLWSAPSLPIGAFALGPAVYGNYVVMGAGNHVYIYKLGIRVIWPRPPIYYVWRWPPIPPEQFVGFGPDGDPILAPQLTEGTLVR